MDKVKVGIIGTGFSARAHLEALSRLPDIEVTAVAASRIDKAEQFANHFGLSKAYGDANELINDPDVEVIHNCTPNHLHFPINRSVLLAGKHLMSEKPLALNSKESQELNELAQKSISVSGVCFNYRHYAMVAQVKDAIAGGEYGKVHLVYGGYFQDWLLYDTDYNWRLDPKINGTSRAIADIGSHWCDTVQYVLGRNIVEVFADLKIVHPVRRKPKGQAGTIAQSDDVEREDVVIQTEDYGSVLVHFDDGIHGVFTVSQVSAGRKNRLHFEITAEKATLAWDQEESNHLWIGRRDQANSDLLRDPALLSPNAASLAHYPGGHQEGWPDGLKNLFIDYYGAVKKMKSGDTKEYPTSFASIGDGLRIMRLIDAIMESHRSKQWVRVFR